MFSSELPVLGTAKGVLGPACTIGLISSQLFVLCYHICSSVSAMMVVFITAMMVVFIPQELVSATKSGDPPLPDDGLVNIYHTTPCPFRFFH